jgi:hypothetical protein
VERKANWRNKRRDSQYGRSLFGQKLLQNAFKRPFYTVHCVPHCLNQINGRSIAALRDTSSGWFEKVYVAVKFLRKQSNLIETMGTQRSDLAEVRWSLLSQILQCYRTKDDKLQEFYISAEAKGFSDLTEAPDGG